ncbi:hypothetical protein HK097_001567 [Rhizophlyctis rosea]|uniref:Beta-xylanase n=1 Tax=Rhizophlyctis rosea TaxID=64517 RepID=A0AAD5X6T6_9FUNG|nr:hypothetical protein HK097_001567 [Rhizophlyctis rosea]
MKVLAFALAAAALLETVAGQTLKAAANRNGKYFGAALNEGNLNDATYNQIGRTEFDYLTHENSMKWEAIHPSQNTYSYTNADRLISFAETNGLKIRGHTLVWHSQLPSWVANGQWTRQTLTAAIQDHVTTIVGRYKGRIAQYDVVNEIFNEDGTARDSVFSRTFGGLNEFVTIAFNAARAADPAAILCINDYNLDYTGAKATAMVNLVRTLKSQGVPIDCIGSQAHLIVGQISSTFEAALRSFAALNVDVAITELDIRTNTPASSSALQTQASDYTRVTKACVDIPRCIGITVWGITDKYSWIPGVFSGQGAALPWDDNYNKKPAYNGILAGFPAGSTTTTTTRTTTTTTTTRTTTQNPGTCGSTVTVTASGNTVTVNGPAVTVTVTAGGNQQTTTQQPPRTTTTTNGTTQGAALYGQCGGQGWTGPTTCRQGTCRVSNQYYSQCLP